jgi:hypothetical protein
MDLEKDCAGLVAVTPTPVSGTPPGPVTVPEMLPVAGRTGLEPAGAAFKTPVEIRRHTPSAGRKPARDLIVLLVGIGWLRG